MNTTAASFESNQFIDFRDYQPEPTLGLIEVEQRESFLLLTENDPTFEADIVKLQHFPDNIEVFHDQKLYVLTTHLENGNLIWSISEPVLQRYLSPLRILGFKQPPVKTHDSILISYRRVHSKLLNPYGELYGEQHIAKYRSDHGTRLRLIQESDTKPLDEHSAELFEHYEQLHSRELRK